MVTRIAARARLQMTIRLRLRTRSTIAPAPSAITGNGMRWAAMSSPTAAAPAWKTKMASVGRASTVTWLPISLTIWPPQSRPKSC